MPKIYDAYILDSFVKIEERLIGGKYVFRDIWIWYTFLFYIGSPNDVTSKWMWILLTPLIEKFEDTKGVSRSRELKERQQNGQTKKEQKDKQWSTKY